VTSVVGIDGGHFITESRFSKLDNGLRHHVTFCRRTFSDTNMKFYDMAQ
jgi:hypothetical protein